MSLIVGTAGHIDHGKTALVRALTGTDTDRLPEEKKRGITVDLGFAEMKIGAVSIGFVDVPGHERFVKNMLAGATGIDLVLLVIAADEGVMPQTREHFDICRLLGIEAGIVVLTKTDLVDEETLELARLDAAELTAGSFLENADVVEVSAKAGTGLDSLKGSLAALVSVIPKPVDGQKAARLSIDRSFTVKGFGAVVTGTLTSGEIAEGEEVELLPAGRRLRVRGVQSHGVSVSAAEAGVRTALNVAGIDLSELGRGMTIATAGVFEPTRMIDTQVEMLSSAAKALKTRQRIRLHVGTDELLARVYVLNTPGEIPPGESDFVQLRLESETVAAAGDRFILRAYSPAVTIGGGEVLDPRASKHRKPDLPAVREHLQALFASRENIPQQILHFVRAAKRRGLSERDTAARTGLLPHAIKTAIACNSGRVIELNGRFVTSETAEGLSAEVKATLAQFHRSNALECGMPRVTLRASVFARLPTEIFEGTLGKMQREGAIVQEKEVVRLPAHSTQLTPAESAFKSAIEIGLAAAGLQPPKIAEIVDGARANGSLPPATEKRLLQLVLGSGHAVKVNEEFYFDRSAVDDLIAKLRLFAGSSPGRVIDMAQFKELTGVTRKHAIPLSEYLDRERVTVRRGDKRVIV